MNLHTGTSRQDPKPTLQAHLYGHPDFAQWLKEHPKPTDGPAKLAGKPKPIAMLSAMDIGQIQSYAGSRSQDWNHCGQAAIAALLDFHQKPLGPLGLPHWDDGAAIDQIVNDGFGPDVAFGLGTSGGRIKDALSHYGLTHTGCGYSGAGDLGWGDCWTSVQSWVQAGQPVPCCVDTGTLGEAWYEAHWLIIHAIDSSDVHVANWSTDTIPVQTFLASWACHFLPYGYNHCYVTGQ